MRDGVATVSQFCSRMSHSNRWAITRRACGSRESMNLKRNWLEARYSETTFSECLWSLERVNFVKRLA